MVDERRVVTHSDEVYTTDPLAPAAATSVSRREVTYRDSGNSLLQRVIIFIFGIIQGLLLLRIVLLLIAARERNDLVSLIYNVSEIFVAPFRGILGRDRSPPARPPSMSQPSSR